MPGVFTVIGTLARGYNRRAARILVEGGLDRKTAKTIASAGVNRTFWTGKLVPDMLFKAGVSPQAVGELDKAGLLKPKNAPAASFMFSNEATRESIRLTRIPLEPVNLEALSQAIGEKVRLSCHLDIDVEMTRQLVEIVKGGFFRHLWAQNIEFGRMCREKDHMIIILQSESTKRILGFIVGGYDMESPEDTYVMEVLAVRNEHRGKGIGKALISAFFKELESQKYKAYRQVALFCNLYDKHGRNLVEYYKKAGFVMAGIDRGLTKMVAPTAHADLTVPNMIYRK